MTQEVRTQDEILSAMQQRTEALFDFFPEVCVDYLDYAHAKPLLKDEVTAEEWDKVHKPLTREQLIDDMRSYMSFAWDKANNERGLSSVRSVQKMQAFLFMLNDAEGYEFALNEDNYASYGRPILSYICTRYDFQNEDETRNNISKE